MKTVTKIPPKRNPLTFAPLEKVEKRRVAAYARVSTDSDEQKTSYDAQVDYYTKYIKERSDWEFVGIYTDEGISATNTKHRDGFNMKFLTRSTAIWSTLSSLLPYLGKSPSTS